MSGTILPYELNVESVVYHTQAFALGMIKPNIQHYDSWLCNKYINCLFYTGFNFDMYDEDVLSLKEGLSVKIGGQIVYEALQVLYPDLIEKNKAMLNQGYYIWGTYDEFYIPGKTAHQRYHFIHSYVIYGYDDNEGVFKSAGYLADGRYNRFNIKYGDYLNSIMCGEVPHQRKLDYVHINSAYEGYIDVPHIREQLLNFLNSYGRSNPSAIAHYGVSAWQQLETYLSSDVNTIIDMRYMRAYMEHKRIMDHRIKHLTMHGYLNNQTLSSEYHEAIFLKSMQLFYMSIKFLIKNDAEILNRMVTIVQDINIREEKLIENVVSEL